MFEKKETIFKKKDRQTWGQIRNALKEAGVKFSSGHYLQETLMPCGCGARLDPRDLGPGGKVDRNIYYIRVRVSDVQRAEEVMQKCGLQTAAQ